MHLFFESAIRGGICQVACKRSEAYNRFMDNVTLEDIGSKDEKYIAYMDICNLYGKSMSDYLPFGNFQWVSNPESFLENNCKQILDISNTSPIGYVFEVDLEYPEELHDYFSDLPFCPIKAKPKPTSTTEKLLLTLHNKQKYIIHYRALKQCLEHGIKVTKIHRAISFSQSDWLKSYIDLNTQRRKDAVSEFAKNLFKLMNNSVYGKTIENVRDRENIKISTQWSYPGRRQGAINHIRSPYFKSFSIIDENLVLFNMHKSSVYLNKPIYLGMSILDISKTYLYEFHYDYMLKRYKKESIKLLYTDTDSLIYELKNKIDEPNFYDHMRMDNVQRFDTSDFPDNNPYNIKRMNKKVIGLMKDELSGEIIYQFIGLRPKCYSYLTKNKINKRAKGVIKKVTETFTKDDYLQALGGQDVFINQKSIISKNHIVQSIAQRKCALNANDDKRVQLPGSYDTLPYGHISLKFNN